MGFFKSIGRAISSVGHAVSNGVSGLVDGVKSVVDNPLVQGVGNMGKNLLQGAGNSIGNALGYNGQLGTDVGKTLSGGYHALVGDGSGSGPNSGLMGGISSLLGGVSTVRSAWEDAFNRHPDGTVKSASEMGNDTRDYLANAFPELNPWERSGAGGSMSGIQSAIGMANQNQIVDKQLKNQVKLNQMNNDTAVKIASMNNQTALQQTDMSNATSVANVQAQLEPVRALLPAQLKKLASEVASIDANTSLTPERRQQLKTQAASAIAGANLSDQQANNVIQQTRITTQQAETNQGAFGSAGGKALNDASNVIYEIGKRTVDGISSSAIPRMSASQIKKAYVNGQGKSTPWSLH